MAEIPYGYCRCGCGEKTNLATKTNVRSGHKKGEPLYYINGHYGRGGLPDWTVDPETGCWVTAHRRKHGYVQLRRNGRHIQAHRYVYEVLVGPIPEGLHLDHLCRHRACVNPDHLEPVTCAENIRRGLRPKLTPAIVRYLRSPISSHLSGGALAKEFGVSRSAITAARRGVYWADVTEEAA